MTGTESRAEALLAPTARAAGSPFALGEVPRAWGDLLADSGTLAAELPACAGRQVMVACADRYFTAVALLAIWHRGGVAALPPNGRQETIDRLCLEREISMILHDGGGQGELGFDIRERLARGGPSATGIAPPVFAAARTLVTVYTSGSTGAHLACPKTAGQLLGEAALLARLFDLGPGTRLVATVPSHHLYGLLFGILVPFMGGGAFVRATPLHAESIAGEAQTWGANVLVSVPAHLRGLARVPAGALPGLARVFSSGAPLEASTAAEAAAVTGTPVTEVLGSSETGGIAWREAPGGAGWQTFPGVEVTPDADGRMLVRSPFVAAGETDAAGFYRGADRIAPRAGGGFDLLGRADGVVKIGGSRIALAETERLLREIPGVADAAVITVEVPGPRRHELLAAVVAPDLDVPALRAALLRRLEPIAVPRRFRIVAALPREDNGKLVRERLLSLFEAPARLTLPFSVPRDWKYFRGHFDDFAILAGVVQLQEIVLREVHERWSDLQQLRRIRGLKFRQPIAPGDDLSLELGRPAARQVTFELRRGGDVVSSGALEFARSGEEGPPPA